MLWGGSPGGEISSRLLWQEYEDTCSQLGRPGSREKGNGGTQVAFSFFLFY